METTKKTIKPHKQLVTFFSDTAIATRGFRPAITPKDAQNLKRVLDLNILDQAQIEQLMLYFLADKNYKNLGPSLATIFSGTILNSLRNAAINRTKYYKELDEYAARYLRTRPKLVHTDGPTSIGDLIGRLASQMTLDRSNAPRAPVRVAERSSKKKPLTLFETQKL